VCYQDQVNAFPHNGNSLYSATKTLSRLLFADRSGDSSSPPLCSHCDSTGLSGSDDFPQKKQICQEGPEMHRGIQIINQL